MSRAELKSSGILDEISSNLSNPEHQTDVSETQPLQYLFRGQENRDRDPYMDIVVQPQQRGFRFRYECEGSSHGGIQGESNEVSGKNYPTVKIHGYTGPARLTVTLVTDEKVPKPHAHELVGKHCSNGICVLDVESCAQAIQFPGLSIRHSTRKRAVSILTDRILESTRSFKLQRLIQERKASAARGIDTSEISITEAERREAQTEAEEQAKTMQLNTVRLCFQAQLMAADKTFFSSLPHCVSLPIYDSKSPAAAALKICRMDRHAGCCTGNDEVFLLCDKVQKDDIEVRFFEEDSHDGNPSWLAYGSFSAVDVHRQFAIVFKTPAYWNVNIQEPVKVKMQLYRKSDNEYSQAKDFTYFPVQPDLEDLARKRRKVLPKFALGLASWGGGGTETMSRSGSSGPIPRGPEEEAGDKGSSGPREHAKPDVRDSRTQTPSYVEDGFQSASGSVVCQPTTPNEGGGPSVGPAPGMPLSSSYRRPRVVADCAEVLPPAQPMFELAGKAEPDLMRGRSCPDLELPADALAPKLRRSITLSPNIRVQEPELVTVPPEKPAPLGMTSDEGLTLVTLGPSKHEAKSEANDSAMNSMSLQSSLNPVAFVCQSIASGLVEGLREYARTGDVSCLLKAQRHLIAESDAEGDNVIHDSVLFKQHESLRNLLRALASLPEDEQGAVNQRNDVSLCPLHLATQLNDAAMVELLLSQGASPAKQDGEGDNAFHRAARIGSATCLESILVYGAKPLNGINQLNYAGLSPLHQAVAGGHQPCVKLLVANGRADVNVQDAKSGRTPLHMAVERDHVGIVSYLLMEGKADCDFPSYDGATALRYAVVRDYVGCAAILLAHGADPEAEEVGEEEEEEERRGRTMDEDKDVDEAEKSGSDDTDVVPVTPKVKRRTLKDLAWDQPKMLSLLEGSPYMAGIQAELTTVGPTTTWVDAPADSDPGDLDHLDAMVRTRLARCLDGPEQDLPGWRVLAGRLGLEMLVTPLGALPSPTKGLLDNYEALDGSIVNLRSALEDMGRLDAVTLIDEVKDVWANRRTPVKARPWNALTHLTPHRRRELLETVKVKVTTPNDRDAQLEGSRRALASLHLTPKVSPDLGSSK